MYTINILCTVPFNLVFGKMDNNVYRTTKSGLEKLKKELKEREEVTRAKIATVLNEMRSQGDLRENDGYSMAVENQNINEEKIAELKEKIKNAQIIPDSKKNTVGIGSIVTLEGEKSLEYEITSQEEANPLEGKISHLSPIGQSVLNKKVGSEIEINTPAGVAIYKIKNIA